MWKSTFDAQQNAVAAAADTCDARRYRYTAFGNLAAGTDASWCDLTANQWGVMDAEGWGNLSVCDPGTNQTFGGQKHYYHDPETELYLLGGGTSGGGRYYDPATGRFLSRDPIGFAGGDVNLYRYVRNNPVNSVDPSGRQIGTSENRSDIIELAYRRYHILQSLRDAQVNNQLSTETFERRIKSGPNSLTVELTLRFGLALAQQEQGIAAKEEELERAFARYERIVEPEGFFGGSPVRAEEESLQEARDELEQSLQLFAALKLGEAEPYTIYFASAMTYKGVSVEPGSEGARNAAIMWAAIPDYPGAISTGDEAFLVPALGVANAGRAAVGAVAARRSATSVEVAAVPRTVLQSTDEVYAGVRQASKTMQDLGISRNVRKQVLRSFDVRALRVRVASESEFGIRYFDNIDSLPRGRFLFETFPASRNSLALQTQWNQMRFFKQWRIRPGATIFEGPTLRQGIWRGGQTQKYIFDPARDLLEP